MLAATRNPLDRYVSAQGQFEVESPPQSFVVYGKDRATTEGVERPQEAWIICMAILEVGGVPTCHSYRRKYSKSFSYRRRLDPVRTRARGEP